MKLIYTFLVVTLLLFAGCKQELQTTVSKYVNTPVVYGVLNMYETYPSPNGSNTHFIRIQKGYLLKGNAYLAAGIEDSIYYPDTLVVKIIGSLGFDSFTLNRVDGATVGLNKDTGIFANVPNYLYTFNQFLDSTETYTLRITGKNYADTFATATTALVNNVSINYPNNNGLSEFSFSNIPGQEGIVSWNIGNNSGVYDLTIRFYYNEYSKATNQQIGGTDYVDIPVFSSYIPTGLTGNIATYTVPASLITNYLGNNLTVDPTVFRTFQSMQFTIFAGGTGLLGFFNEQQAQSGLTSSNALPAYTNITEGVGLLSSRESAVVSNIILGNPAKDSLACGPVSNLNFTNSLGNTCN